MRTTASKERSRPFASGGIRRMIAVLNVNVGRGSGEWEDGGGGWSEADPSTNCIQTPLLPLPCASTPLVTGDSPKHSPPCLRMGDACAKRGGINLPENNNNNTRCYCLILIFRGTRILHCKEKNMYFCWKSSVDQCSTALDHKRNGITWLFSSFGRRSDGCVFFSTAPPPPLQRPGPGRSLEKRLSENSRESPPRGWHAVRSSHHSPFCQ